MAKLTFSQYENLQKKGLSPEQIQTLADKHGYKLPSESILGSAAKALLVKPADRLAEVVGRTGILGENIKRGYEQGGDRIFNTPFGETKVEEQKGFGSGGGRQVLADTLESASYLAPVGSVTTGLTKMTGKALLSGAVANAGSGYLADVSANVREGKDGASALAPGLGTVFGGALPFAGATGKAGSNKAKEIARFITSRLTGLRPETVTTAITNPTALRKAELDGLSRINVAEQVEKAFKERLDDLSITGKQYQSLISNNGKKEVQIPETLVKNILAKYGLSIEESRIVPKGFVDNTINPEVEASKKAKSVTLDIRGASEKAANKATVEKGLKPTADDVEASLGKKEIDIRDDRNFILDLRTGSQKYAPTMDELLPDSEDIARYNSALKKVSTKPIDIRSLQKKYGSTWESFLTKAQKKALDAERAKDAATIVDRKIKIDRESVPISQADIDALERFILQYGSETSATTNSFLNTRKALDQLSDWEQGKTDVPGAIARELRRAYDEIGKKTIPGLRELDDEYAPKAEEIKNFRKYMFDSKGRLLESGVNRIANATGLGKEKVLEKLEALVPGIGQQLQVLKALQDITDTSGNKVGTYTASLFGGAGYLSGGPVGAIIGLAISSPAVTIPILRNYGRVNGFSKEVIERVSQKLMTGKTLNAGDLMLFRKALENHIANLQSDKFDEEQEDVTTQ